MKEIWKDIKDYEGCYQISNFGRVKSLKRKGKIKEIIMKLGINTSGYSQICLTREGVGVIFSMGRLVGLHFVSNPCNYSQINHIDGIKSNNKYHNLEWCTKSQNTQHAYDNGLLYKGQDHPNSKLNELQVRVIRRARIYFSLRELGDIFGVRSSTISRINSRYAWKHI